MNPNVRPDSMERITNFELANKFIDEQVALVREQVGDKKVLLALSGGVDSSYVLAVSDVKVTLPDWWSANFPSIHASINK